MLTVIVVTCSSKDTKAKSPQYLLNVFGNLILEEVHLIKGTKVSSKIAYWESELNFASNITRRVRILKQ